MPQPQPSQSRPRPENRGPRPDRGPRPERSHGGNQGGRSRFRRDRRKKSGSGGGANSQSSVPVPIPEGLVFYCKSCQQIVDYKPKTFDFKYPIDGCLKGKADVSEEKRGEMMCDLAYGTERSIKHFYKIKDEKFDKERREREERAQRADKF